VKRIAEEDLLKERILKIEIIAVIVVIAILKKEKIMLEITSLMQEEEIQGYAVHHQVPILTEAIAQGEI